MMRIEINNLRIDTVIGTYESERHIEQTLWLSIAFSYDASAAASSDQFEHAIDYDALSKALSLFIQRGKYRLIETAVRASCQFLLSEYPMEWVEVSISKPSALERAETVKAIGRLDREPNALS